MYIYIYRHAYIYTYTHICEDSYLNTEVVADNHTHELSSKIGDEELHKLTKPPDGVHGVVTHSWLRWSAVCCGVFRCCSELQCIGVKIDATPGWNVWRSRPQLVARSVCYRVAVLQCCSAFKCAGCMAYSSMVSCASERCVAVSCSVLVYKLTQLPDGTYGVVAHGWLRQRSVCLVCYRIAVTQCCSALKCARCMVYSSIVSCASKQCVAVRCSAFKSNRRNARMSCMARIFANGALLSFHELDNRALRNDNRAQLSKTICCLRQSRNNL